MIKSSFSLGFSLLQPTKPVASLYFIVPLSSVIAFTLPAQSFSLSTSTHFNLYDFSHTANNIGVDINVEALAISNTGSIETRANFDTIFVSDQSQVSAQSFSQTSVIGNGSSYFGKGAIISQAVGDFFIPAQESFSFTYQGFLNTEKTINQERYATLGSFSLFLVDDAQNSIIYNLNLFKESRFDNAIQQTIFQIAETGNQTLNNYSNHIISNNSTQVSESLQFGGQFQDSFHQDMQLSLYAVTQNQSCVNNINNNGICDFPSKSVAVPSPSNILGTLLMFSFLIIRFIKKHIL